jgi:hypothetical protein
VLTGLVVGAVIASRPDLVHGARLVRGLDTPSPGGSGGSTSKAVVA